MDCKYTAYDRIIHITEKLPKDKISEAIEIIQEDSFQDLLDFCVSRIALHRLRQSHCMILLSFLTLWMIIILNLIVKNYLHCMTQLVYQKICRLQYSVSTFSDVPLATVKEIRSQITD